MVEVKQVAGKSVAMIESYPKPPCIRGWCEDVIICRTFLRSSFISMLEVMMGGGIARCRSRSRSDRLDFWTDQMSRGLFRDRLRITDVDWTIDKNNACARF